MPKTPLGPPPPPPIVSDVRLKADVAPLDAAAAGLMLYRFRYRDSDAVHVGVMAQEVLQVMPEAVSTGEDGYLRVDYARLGLRMMDYADWRGDPEDARIRRPARLGPPPPPGPSDVRLKRDLLPLGRIRLDRPGV